MVWILILVHCSQCPVLIFAGWALNVWDGWMCVWHSRQNCGVGHSGGGIGHHCTMGKQFLILGLLKTLSVKLGKIGRYYPGTFIFHTNIGNLCILFSIVLWLCALLTLHKIVHEASPRCGATFRHFLFLNVVHARNIKVKGVGNIGFVC